MNLFFFSLKNPKVHVIEREIELNSKGTIVRKKLERLESITQTSEFQLHDALDFFKCGIEVNKNKLFTNFIQL